MKTIIAAFVLCICSTFAMAQDSDVPKDLKDPAMVVARESPNLHDVQVLWPRMHEPIVKDRKVVSESAVVPPNQNYQAACADGNVKRCSGVDFTTFESTIRVKKSERMLPKISKPALVNIKFVAEVEERRPSPRKRYSKRR